MSQREKKSITKNVFQEGNSALIVILHAMQCISVVNYMKSSNSMPIPFNSIPLHCIHPSLIHPAQQNRWANFPPIITSTNSVPLSKPTNWASKYYCSLSFFLSFCLSFLCSLHVLCLFSTLIWKKIKIARFIRGNGLSWFEPSDDRIPDHDLQCSSQHQQRT